MLHHTSEITGSVTVHNGSITLTNGTFNGTATSASYATFAETANVETTHQYDSVSSTSILPRLGTNTSCASYSSVLGGLSNQAVGGCTTVGGGGNNCAGNNFSVVAGGSFNCALGACSTVAGGYSNYVASTWGTVGGGNNNTANSTGNTIAGGNGNITNNNYSTVGGGTNNSACAPCSFIGGGFSNFVNSTGGCSGILGGYDNTVNCAHSFVIGCSITDCAANTVHANNVCVFCETRTQTLVETSAKRCKKHIRPLDSQLAKVKQLKPVNFSWKKDNSEDIGFIAEDINEIYPDLVSWEENGEIHGVKYTKLTSILVKALQEQQLQIDELKEEVKALKSKI